MRAGLFIISASAGDEAKIAAEIARPAASGERWMRISFLP
jgi:hypothetical protein